MESSMTILDELQQAGWDPFEPSEECRTATARPPMSVRLGKYDIMGIHWCLVYLQLVRKFGRGKSWRGERGKQLMFVAVVFVLKQVTLRKPLTPQTAESLGRRLDRWLNEVYLPARERMQQAAEAGVDVVAEQAQFEPAFSMMYHEHKLGIVDIDSHVKTMALARAMHEEDTLTPREIVPTSLDELDAYFAMLCDGRGLVRMDGDGKLRLCAKEVKSALDAEFGREKKDERSCELEPAQEPTGSPGAVIEEVQVRLDVQAIRGALAERRSRAKPGSARAHVLAHFERLVGGDTTFRELGQEVGMSASALEEAYAEETKAIAALIRAA